MSLTLLSNYDSSDESDHDRDQDGAENDSASKDSSTNPSTTAEGKNFFIGGTSDSEEASVSDSDDDSGSHSHSYQKGNPEANPPLPRPFDSTSAASTSSVSVFRNPFLEAERAETDLLEQHVKLTETAYHDRLNDARERAKHRFRKSSLPCRQFKRGWCRMGDKCRFLHASFPSSAPGGLPESSSAPNIYGGKAVRYTEWGKEEVVNSADEDGDGKKTKKRRVGVTNSLVPPKRAIASYEKQRREVTSWLNH